mgnify:FL=1
MKPLFKSPAFEHRDVDKGAMLESYIAAMAEGRKDAVTGLFQQTKAAVYGFSLSILKNMQDAEDVLQDTYIQIYRASGKYQPKGNPMPWIFTITRNLALMKLRERKKIQIIPPESLDWPDDGSPITAEDKLVLSAAMETLSEEERQIIMLHAVAGFKHREIAELLELPLPTVLSKYHRALRKLRIRLQGE